MRKQKQETSPKRFGGQTLNRLNYKNTTNIAKVKEAWGDYLVSFSWQWFVTLSFRHNVSKKSANKKWNKWRRVLELELDEPIGYFRCTEIQKCRGALHFHALVLNIDRLEHYEYSNFLRAEQYYRKKKMDFTEEQLRQLAIRFYWNDKWYEMAGIGRVLPYTKPASYYLSKYVSKELSDYKLGGCVLRT